MSISRLLANISPNRKREDISAPTDLFSLFTFYKGLGLAHLRLTSQVLCSHLAGFLLTFMTKHQHCPLCHFEGHCLLAGDVGHSSCVNGGQSQVVKRIFKTNRLRHSGTATIGQYGQGRAFGQMVATHTPFKVHHKVLFHCSCFCPQTVCKGKQGQIAKDVILSSSKTP